MNPRLTVEILKRESRRFAEVESQHWEPTLYGVTDGKAVGTYFEHKFRAYLRERYEFAEGSSASGIDFPELETDVKVTSLEKTSIILSFSRRPTENIRPWLFVAHFCL